MNAPAIKFDAALQQAGVQVDVHRVGDFELSQLSSVSLLRLHSLQARTQLNATLADRGIHLPGRINQSSGQDPSVLCLAPGEWLMFSEYLNKSQLHEQLQAIVQPGLTTISNQTSALAVFRLRGKAAPWLLTKSCALDLHQGLALNQNCTRTRLDQAPAILHHHQPGSGSGAFVFDVMIDRSLACYVWQLFLSNLPHALELEQQHRSY
jgi:heterotetrameric sarcosine oxidase gamma subunit